MPLPEHDLTAHADTLGDPADYFVDHEGRDKPLVVRHEDGIPTHVIEADGSLTPYGSPVPAEGPAAEVVGNLDYRADDASFSDA